MLDTGRPELRILHKGEQFNKIEEKSKKAVEKLHRSKPRKFCFGSIRAFQKITFHVVVDIASVVVTEHWYML